MFADERFHGWWHQASDGKLLLNPSPYFRCGNIEPQRDLLHAETSSGARALRPWKNQKAKVPSKFVGLLPGRQQLPLIRSHNPEKGALGMALLHGPKGIHCVGDSSLFNFPIRNLSPPLSFQALAKHGQPGPIPSHGTDFFQGRVRAGQKNHSAQTEQFAGRSREEKVTEMKGIKGPAKKTDPQS